MAVITAANLSGTELVAMEDTLVEYTETWAVIGRALNPAFAAVALEDRQLADDIAIIAEKEEEEKADEELEPEEPNAMLLDENGDDLFVDEELEPEEPNGNWLDENGDDLFVDED